MRHRSQKVSLVLTAFSLVIFAQTLCLAGEITLSPPAQDQWQYIFNGNVGHQAQAPCFVGPLSGPYAGQFDYRDGMMILRFDTSARITPSLGADSYQLDGVTLILNHPAGTFTWDTRNPVVLPTGDAFQIEVFGVGVDESVQTAFTRASWIETSPVFAKSPFNTAQIRTPHPLNIDDTAPTQNMTNQSGATPWGIGLPVYGDGTGQQAGKYDPNVETANPFPVTFTINAANARVNRYIREGLNDGYLLWIVCSLAEGSQSGGNNYPRFYTKEGPANLAPKLVFENLSTAAAARPGAWTLYE